MGDLWTAVIGSGLFTGPAMANTWIAATVVAVIAGLVGFFVVLRGAAFAAHALPRGGFAGAAGASLLGLNTVLGLLVFCLLGAAGIAWLGRRARNDIATALVLVLMLGTGALFLSWSSQYEPEIFSLLFGEVLGVSNGQLVDIGWVAAAALVATAGLYRPLLFTSVAAEMAQTRGLRPRLVETAFLLLVGLSATVTVPVVGALLCFSLMIGPAAAARTLTRRPLRALALSVGLALLTVWVAITIAYLTGWPIGFFVGSVAALAYAGGRALERFRERQRVAPRQPDGLAAG